MTTNLAPVTRSERIAAYGLWYKAFKDAAPESRDADEALYVLSTLRSLLGMMHSEVLRELDII